MLSELRERKLTRFFHVLDHNQDGVLSPEDFSQTTEQIIQLKGWTWNDPQYEELHFFWRGFSDRLQVWADRNADGKITLAEWLWYLTQMLDQFEAYYVKQALIHVTLQVMDFSADGLVSLDEFQRFFDLYNIDQDTAKRTFVRLDLNQDCRLTKGELTELFNEFLYSEDSQAPGNWFWGEF